MKKFVGLVNGKSFDNEKDFNDAADKAIKENNGSLSISSYYTYTSDDVEENKDDKFVPASEYCIGNRKPDKVDKDSIEYTVSPELKNRIKTASNKDSIEQNLKHSVLNYLDFQIIKNEDENLSLQKDIEKLQNKLYTVTEDLKYLKGRKKYYDEIINVINESDNEHKSEENTKKSESVDEKKNKIRKVLDVDPDTSLFTFLTQLGFFK